MKTSRREDVRLLVALRAEAGKYDAISELKMSRCTAFMVHGRIVACAGDNLIALRLTELSVTALLHTPGSRRFQPYGRPHYDTGLPLRKRVQHLLRSNSCSRRL
jgi:hypothetical protein